MEELFWISTSYATFGIVAENGIVIETAPIAKWAIGKKIGYVLLYYDKTKNAEIKKIRE